MNLQNVASPADFLEGLRNGGFVTFTGNTFVECRGRAIQCIALKFWRCQNVGSNPGLALVSLGKTLNRNCFVLRMGHKAVHVGPVCCAMHVK